MEAFFSPQHAGEFEAHEYKQHGIIVKNPSSVPRVMQAVICSLRRADVVQATRYAQGLVNGGQYEMLLSALVPFILQHYCLTHATQAQEAVVGLLEAKNEDIDCQRLTASYVVHVLCMLTPSRLVADLTEIFSRGLTHIDDMLQMFGYMTTGEVYEQYRASFRTPPNTGPGLMPMIRELTARMAAGHYLLGHNDVIGVEFSAGLIDGEPAATSVYGLLAEPELARLCEQYAPHAMSGLLAVDKVHVADTLVNPTMLGPFNTPELNLIASVPDYAYNPAINEGTMIARRIEQEAGAAKTFLTKHGVTMPAARAQMIGQAIRELETDWFARQYVYQHSKTIAAALRQLRFAPMLENANPADYPSIIGEFLQLCSGQILPGYLLKARLEVTEQKGKV
ncbi:hypothetical protein WK13_34435 [Burkholderia ubonensis]|uniref:hypothetical protein n=1 Tax=Burkholderia ubonensis TaxID=101571 RepID=UPI00075B4737|nr:hypothetical protein [Burkholderia ubonensis]KVR21638.1 hypothetical protein WK13_34435 [Burkholderia ubonensis]